MKRFFFILLTLFLLCAWRSGKAGAQNNQEKRLQFVYIDHEETTPTQELNSRLTQRFYDVGEFPDREALILYISNGRKSPVAFVNLQEYASDELLSRITASGQRRDTESAFKDALATLDAISHTVEPLIDIDNILSLIEQLHFFDENGMLNFKTVSFDFYVGPKFWQHRNNERIIARLYALIQQGIQDSEKEKISFNVFKHTSIQLDYTEGKPFGEANLNGINEKLTIMEY